MGNLLSVRDLTDRQVHELLGRATELHHGASTTSNARHMALVFFEPSLRTRLGFVAAANRLGWATPAEIDERRSSADSKPESIQDTIAVVGAYFDTLIVRYDRPIHSIMSAVPASTSVINAGDRGPDAEHPTQALLDLLAMQHLVGDLSDLRVAVCGDLRMRSARSLIQLLRRLGPAELTLITDEALMEEGRTPEEFAGARLVDGFEGLSDLDAVHVVGIPHGAASEEVRTRLRVDARVLTRLTPRGKVFSPMPVIDEIAQSVRSDDRMGFLAQSALGLPMRMALLEAL